MTEMQTLMRKRSSIKGLLTRFKNILPELIERREIKNLQARLIDCKTWLNKFNEVQFELEVLDTEQIGSDARDTFEKEYYDCLSIAETALDDMVEKPALDTSNLQMSNLRSENVNNINVKLPTLQLPCFSGAVEDWTEFYESFDSLINQNEELSNIHKFQYLKSCLKNEAAGAISALTLSAANYDIALEILKNRFENKRFLIRSHVNGILNLPQISKHSSKSIRRVLDLINSHMKVLKNIGLPTDQWDVLIIQMIVVKMDPSIREKWESVSKDIPLFSELESFLLKTCKTFEALEFENKSQQKSNNQDRGNANSNAKRFSHFARSELKSVCHVCKGDHVIDNCPEFKQLGPRERFRKVQELQLCIVCFKPGHRSMKCWLKKNCNICKKRHNTLLHFANNEVLVNEHSSASSLAEELPPSTTTSLINKCGKIPTQVLLSTAIVNVKDKNNKWHPLRILLDSGSQSNLITKQACKLLQLTEGPVNISVVGISQGSITITSKVKATIQSRFNNFETNISCLVMPRISENIPSININLENIKLPSNLVLADPNFNVSSEVDMLIGAELFYELLGTNRFKLDNSKLIVQQTLLGYIVSGPIHFQTYITKKVVTNLSNVKLDEQLVKFWQTEEIFQKDIKSSEEKACEQHFLSTHTRDKTGRFTVYLPFTDHLKDLQNSENIARQRFISLENKFKINPGLHTKYCEFMKEYEMLGHMERLSAEDYNNKSNIFYLPHHGVYKEESTTTKLRVVFDGTIKSNNSVSLNDVLMIGPKLQEDLFSIVLRFRTHNYVLTADITKMYRQIMIHPDHRNYLRIFWRENSNEALSIFKLTTVTYGTASAPYLAVRTLQKLAEYESESYPLGCNKIMTDFYVDDLLTGGKTVEEVIAIRDQITTVLKKGGFELRKFSSNSHLVFKDLCDNAEENLILDKEHETKLLGLRWDSTSDTLKYSLNSITINSVVTKRTILSVISQLFDPLGLVGPVLIASKILIQTLWLLKLDWDAPVPDHIRNSWLDFVAQLDNLKELKIPRHLFQVEFEESIQLHGFCDASQAAYGACVYARTTSKDNGTSIKLICAKSRVAPTKTVSLPRLELCGALLLAELITKVRSAIKIFAEVFLWTDSTIVLCWLDADPSTWNTYVANRVSKIQTLTEGDKWNHVSTNDNPADIISRGISPRELTESTLWWNGPHWLSLVPTLWPKRIDNGSGEVIEKRRICVNLNSVENTVLDYNRFSSFNKLQRSFAMVLRFIYNCRNNEKRKGTLLLEELEMAATFILRNVQNSEFALEQLELSKHNTVHNSSRLKSLSPFLDSECLIRVGGRLANAAICYDKKYPIILPSHHYVTKLIIRETHEQQLHTGVQGTLSAIRLKYWIIGGRNACRQIITKCISCFRFNAKGMNQKMANLPLHRVEPLRPFFKCGVDYAGPLLIKEGHGRGKRSIKAYIALFICFATKAIHIELVLNLTTESFLGAFKRFMARRGFVSHIFSDNATNFLGANRELDELATLVNSDKFKNTMVDSFAQNKITWHFIPPRSPHFGGLWEAGVKSVKGHLKRVVGDALLTYDEMYTVLTSIEAILNSRPLIPLSNDPNDLSTLTPGHFLIGEPLRAPAEPSLTDSKINTLSRWQHVEQIRQHFWKRWHREYLHQFQSRPKWQKITTNDLKEGSLVLIIEDNTPPLCWPMGRIISLHHGKDNLVRVVSIKTKQGVVKRGINKVCLFPLTLTE